MSAEDEQKIFITKLWESCVMACGELQGIVLLGAGAVDPAVKRFITVFSAYYQATRHYVDATIALKVKTFFATVAGGMAVDAKAALAIWEEYDDACYRKGVTGVKEAVRLRQRFRPAMEAEDHAA